MLDRYSTRSDCLSRRSDVPIQTPPYSPPSVIPIQSAERNQRLYRLLYSNWFLIIFKHGQSCGTQQRSRRRSTTNSTRGQAVPSVRFASPILSKDRHLLSSFWFLHPQSYYFCYVCVVIIFCFLIDFIFQLDACLLLVWRNK